MSRIFKALSRIELKAIDRPPAGPISAEELEVFGLRRPSPSKELSLAGPQPNVVVYTPSTGPAIDEIVEPTTAAEQHATDDPLARIVSIEAVRSEVGPATIQARVESPVQLHPPVEAATEQLAQPIPGLSAEATTEQLAQTPVSLSTADATRRLAQTPSDLLAEASTERLAEMTLESSLENLAEFVRNESNAEQDGTRLDEAGVGDDQYDGEEDQEDEEDEEGVASRPNNVDSLLAQIDAMQESVVAEWITAIGSTEVEAVYTTETFDNVLVVERFPLPDTAEADMRPDARLDDNPPEASAATEPTNEDLVKLAESLADEVDDPARAPTIERAVREDPSTKADVELAEPSDATIDSPVESSIELTTDRPVHLAVERSPPEPREQDTTSENSDAVAPTPVERSEASEGERSESLEGATVEVEPRESRPEPETELTTRGGNTLAEQNTTAPGVEKTTSVTETSVLPASPLESGGDGPSVGPLLSVQESSVDETDPHLKSLAENILYQMPARSAVVMFTSSADGEGTSDTLGQVATALAPRLDGEILVVDCNFHNPRSAKFFDLQPQHTLVHILSGETGWAQAVSKTRVEHLSVLAGGKFPTPDGLPPHQADLAMLVTELRHHYRLVLLDTASLSHGEVGALSRLCDATYLVIRLGETSRQTAQQAARLLQNAGGKLRGCVLSNLPVE